MKLGQIKRKIFTLQKRIAGNTKIIFYTYLLSQLSPAPHNNYNKTSLQ